MHLLNRQFFILITIVSINCKALEIEIFFESGIKIESQNVFLKKVNHISNKKDLEFFIKDESWIKDYSIRYIPFSSQAFIYITNREPIFVLNNEFFVDEDLKFFPYDYSKIDIHSVYGPVTRLDNVKTLIEFFKKIESSAIEIYYNHTSGWEVATNKYKVKFGKKLTEEKLNMLNDTMNYLYDKRKVPDMIDLRYKDGVAINYGK